MGLEGYPEACAHRKQRAQGVTIFLYRIPSNCYPRRNGLLGNTPYHYLRFIERHLMSESVLIVDEIASRRDELSRALEAEGFKVVESDSASAAVRDLWENRFVVVLIASVLSDTRPQALAEQLQQMAPEIETMIYAKGDAAHKLARKAAKIRDGEVAA